MSGHAVTCSTWSALVVPSQLGPELLVVEHAGERGDRGIEEHDAGDIGWVLADVEAGGEAGDAVADQDHRQRHVGGAQRAVERGCGPGGGHHRRAGGVAHAGVVPGAGPDIGPQGGAELGPGRRREAHAAEEHQRRRTGSLALQVRRLAVDLVEIAGPRGRVGRRAVAHAVRRSAETATDSRLATRREPRRRIRLDVVCRHCPSARTRSPVRSSRLSPHGQAPPLVMSTLRNTMG